MTSPKKATTYLAQPNELVQQFYLYLDAASLAQQRRLCRRAKDLVDSSLGAWAKAKKVEYLPYGISAKGYTQMLAAFAQVEQDKERFNLKADKLFRSLSDKHGLPFLSNWSGGPGGRTGQLLGPLGTILPRCQSLGEAAICLQIMPHEATDPYPSLFLAACLLGLRQAGYTPSASTAQIGALVLSQPIAADTRNAALSLSVGSNHAATVQAILGSPAAPGETRAAFIQACQDGALEVVHALRSDIEGVSDRQQLLNQAFQSAAVAGRFDTAAELLVWGALLNARDGEGLCALDQAALRGNTAAVRWLIERGAQVNPPGGHNLGLIQTRNCEVAECLLKAGATFNMDPLNFHTPNIGLFKPQAESMVEFWLPKIVTQYAGRPVEALAAAKAPVAVRLVEHGFNINAQDAAGNTALLQLTRNDNAHHNLWDIETLIKLGADITITNHRGEKAFHAGSFIWLLKTLVAAGAEQQLNRRDVDAVIDAAIERQDSQWMAFSTRSFAILPRLLTPQRADLLKHALSGGMISGFVEALEQALHNRDDATVKTLLREVDEDKLNADERRRCLTLAIKANAPAAVHRCLKYLRASPNGDGVHNPPLRTAAAIGNAEIIDLLKRYGADPEQQYQERLIEHKVAKTAPSTLLSQASRIFNRAFGANKAAKNR